MPLTIVPGTLPDQYLLKTGEQVVGYVQRIPPRGLPIDGKWMWATTFAAGGVRADGNVDTREQAEEKVRAHFAAWLDWAALRERT